MTRRLRGWLLPPAAFFLSGGILLGRSASSVLWGLAALLLSLSAVLLLRNRLRWAACMALTLALGFVSGFAAFHPALPPENTYAVQGIVSDEIRSGHYGQVRVFLTDVTLNGQPQRSGAYWTFYPESVPEDLLPGKLASFQASLYHPGGAVNPNGYDFREELLRRGVAFGLYGDDSLVLSDPAHFSLIGFCARLRHDWTQRLCEAMGEEAGGYASALLLGSRSLIPSEDRAAFSRLGIAHILSVSGFHVSILVALLSPLFRLLRFRPGTRLALYAALLFLYCVLCGGSQPVIRASLLILLALLGKMLNRPRSGLHLLSAAYLIIAVLSPVQLTGVSFQLTFGAMLGLTLVTPFLSARCPFRAAFLLRLWNGISVVLGAQLGVLYPVLAHYQELPLLGLLVNLPASAAATALILADWAALITLPIPFLSPVFAWLASSLSSLFLSLIRLAGSLPGITLWTHAATMLTAAGVLLMMAALTSLLRFRPLVRSLMASASAALIAVSLLPENHMSTEYIQFSVGNADAAVLWDQDRVWVMDTGEADGVLSSYLRRHRLTPEGVILTHLHTDHAGGLQSLLDDGIPIRKLYLPEGAEQQLVHEDILLLLDTLKAAGTEIIHLSRGDVLPMPSGTLAVLWPEKGRTRIRQDANNSSMVSRLTLNGVSMLQTGDITGAYEMYTALPADVLRAAHHGSVSSTSPAFLQAVSPRVILLSCAKEARHDEFAGRSGGLPVWSTARSGALTLSFSDGLAIVTPYLPFPSSGGSDHGSQ